LTHRSQGREDAGHSAPGAAGGLVGGSDEPVRGTGGAWTFGRSVAICPRRLGLRVCRQPSGRGGGSLPGSGGCNGVVREIASRHKKRQQGGQ
jgi:hypothetical protein